MLSFQMALGASASMKLHKALCMLQGRKLVAGRPIKLAVGHFKAPGLVPIQWLKDPYLLNLAASKLDRARAILLISGTATI